MAFQLIIEKAGKVIFLQAHQIQHVQAKAGETYRLVDAQTGLAPEDMKARHEGNDLILSSEKEKIEVVIEDFWDACTPDEEQCWAILPMSTEDAGLYEVVLTQEGAEFMPLQATQTGHSVFDGTFWLTTGAILVGTAFAVVSGRGDQDHVSYDKEFAAIEAALAQAQQAQKDAQAKFEALEQSGIVNTQDATELSDMITHMTECKAKADALIQALPRVVAKEKQDYEAQLKAIPNDPTTVPAVNDANSNGKLDTEDLSTAQMAVSMAEKAYNKAKEAIEKLQPKNGKAVAVSQEAHQNTEKLVKDAQEAMASAKEKMKDVPDTDAMKAGKQVAQDKLDKLEIDNLSVPKINDFNGNGKVDSEELKEAQEALQETKQAKQTVEEAIKALADKNSLTEDQIFKVKKLINELDQKKAILVKKVESVSDQNPETKDGKATLESELAKLGNVREDVRIALAQQAVAVAKKAYATAQEKIDEFSDVDSSDSKPDNNGNGLGLLQGDGTGVAHKAVNPQDHSHMEALKTTAESTKQRVAGLLHEFQPNVGEKPLSEATQQKVNSMQATLDSLKLSDIPVVNDADSNGIVDSEEAKVAQALVSKAQQAQQNAQEAINALTGNDKIVNPDKAKSVEQLITTAKEAKEKAQAVVEKLSDIIEESVSHKKTMQETLKDLKDLVAPEINDANANGILDTTDLAKAQEALTSAKKAVEELTKQIEQAKGEANGAIDNPTHQSLEEAKATVQAQLDKAKQMIEQVPNQNEPMKAQRTQLESELNGLKIPEIPAMNDMNSNGILDAQEAVQAQNKVNQAKKADEEAQAKINELSQADKLVTPAEKTAAENLVKTALQAKTKAENLVDQLTELVKDQKASMKAELAKLTVDKQTIPNITDANSNGINDKTDVQNAQNSLKTAEDAYNALKAKIESYENDPQKILDTQTLKTLQTEKTNLQKMVSVAEEKLAQVPDSMQELAGLKQKMQMVKKDLVLPALNDSNDNGVLDTQDVINAQEALTQAKNAVDKFNEKVNDLIAHNKPIAEDLFNELTKEAETAKKLMEKAQSMIDSVSDKTSEMSAKKTMFKEQYAKLMMEDVPTVNDANANGKVDTVELLEATELVNDAEEKHTELKEKLAKYAQGELVQPATLETLKQAMQAMEQAKAAAKEALTKLPDTQAIKTGKAIELQTLEKMEKLTLPQVNDRNNNNILDEQDVANAKKELQAAEEAYTALKAKIDSYNGTPKKVLENDNLTNLQKMQEDLQTKVDTAQTKLNQVPDDMSETNALKQQMNKLKGELDQAKSDIAKVAVEAAKATMTEAQNEANQFGNGVVVNPDNQKTVQEKITVANQAKEKATQVVEALPDSNGQKKGLQDELNKLVAPGVPKVNDQDSNGQIDSKELEAAKAAFNVAKEAYNKAKTMVDAHQAPKATSKEQHQRMQTLKQQAEQKIAEAKAKIDALMAKDLQAEKTQMLKDIAGMTPLAIPAVNDSLGDGKLDTTRAEEAKVLVDKAKTAIETAKKAVEDMKGKGINDEKAKELNELIKTATEAKKVAEDAVNALPPSVKDKQDAMKAALKDLIAPDMVVANDADSNGMVDSEEAKTAQDLVNQAKQAHKKAEDAINSFTGDGKIVKPADLETVKQLIDQAKQAKTTAETEVNKLSDKIKEDVSHKAKMKAELEKLTDLTPPTVNDVNSNGKNDALEITEVAKLVEVAKTAHKAAQDELIKHQGNSAPLVTPTVKTKVDALIQTSTEKKQAAEDAMKQLPNEEQRKLLSSELQTKITSMEQDLKSLTPLTAPKVNDANANGTLDTTDLAQAQTAVTSAETAIQKLTQQITAAKGKANSAITQDMHNALKPVKEEAEKQLEAAKKAVQQVPEQDEDMKVQRTQLEAKLKTLAMPEIPAVNDLNTNGVIDTEEAKQAHNKVEQAKQANQTAQAKIDELSKTGNVVSLAKKTEIEQLVNAAVQAKTQAKSRVEQLTELVKDQKASMQAELAKLKDLTVPDVNDQNNNGVLDTQDLAAAQQALTAAKTDKKALEAELAKYSDANKAVSQETLKKLTAQYEAVKQKVAEAKTKVEQVPNQMSEHTALESQLKELEKQLTLPTVNDENNNGKPDSVDLKEAMALVTQASEKHKALKDKLGSLKDKAIQQSQHNELTQDMKGMEQAKEIAKKALEALPDSPSIKTSKEAQLKTLESLEKLTLPAVNDLNNNGIKDTDDAVNSQRKVTQAQQAMEKAKAEIDKYSKTGMVVNQETHKNIQKLLDQANKDIEAAKTDVNKLSTLVETQKTEQLKTLGDLETSMKALTMPKVNDKNGNGELDTQELMNALTKAKQEKMAVTQKWTTIHQDHFITADEKKTYEQAKGKFDQAKKTLDDLVNKLLDTEQEKTPYQLDTSQVKEAPEVSPIPDKPTSLELPVSGTKLTGQAQPYSTVKVMNQGQVAGTAQTNSDGKFTVTFKEPIKIDESVSVTAQNPNGTSQPETITNELAKVVAGSVIARDDMLAHDMNLYDEMKSKNLITDNSERVGKIKNLTKGATNQGNGFIKSDYMDDDTPTFEFKISKALKSNQQILVTRSEVIEHEKYTLQHKEVVVNDVKLKPNSQTEYTFTDHLPKTMGAKYHYEFMVKETIIDDGKTQQTFFSKPEVFTLGLKTEAQLPELKATRLTANNGQEWTVNPIDIILSGKGVKGDNYTFNYMQNNKHMTDMSYYVTTDGRISMKLDDWDRVNAPTTLYLEEASGNLLVANVNALNGLYAKTTIHQGTKKDSMDWWADSVGSDATGVKATDGNDYFLLYQKPWDHSRGELGNNSDRGQLIEVDLGAGDDTLSVEGSTWPYAEVVMGMGNDRIDLYGKVNNNGYQTMRMFYMDQSNQYHNGFNDYDGNDLFYIHGIDNLLSQTQIVFGNGDNRLMSECSVEKSNLFSGKGDDNFWIYGSVSSTLINMGAGNDVLSIGGDVTLGKQMTGTPRRGHKIWEWINETSTENKDGTITANIYLGEGDDIFFLGGNIKGSGLIDGGEGLNSLMLSGINQNIDLQYFHNFGKINLTSSGDNTLTLTLEDVKRNHYKMTMNHGQESRDILMISGTTGDKVKFSDLYNSNNGQLSSFVSNIHQSSMVDGVKYNMYKSASNSKYGTSLEIWIQDGIQLEGVVG